MMRVIFFLLTLAVYSSHVDCFGLFGGPDFNFDKLIDVAVSGLIGQKSADSPLTPKYYKEFLLNDNTNEDIGNYSAQQIIARSGFEFESHYVVSDDGYITNTIRIVNPLADWTKLKWPPVMIMHGGITDNTIWIWSNAIQHHPERYPRQAGDPPMTSYNTSLIFTLANNGYDVWLVGTRGSNIHNKGHAKLTKHYNWFDRQELAKLAGKKFKPDFEVDFVENFKYWNFTMDDIGQFEVPRQQELILKLTSSNKVTLIDASLSTLINYGVMSENPQFVSRLHNYVTVAPILNNRGTNLAIKLFHETACTKLPLAVGSVLAQLILSPPLRKADTLLNSHKELRYSLIKTVVRVITGPSSQYETNLDSGVVGHIFESTGYKELRQYCQQVIAGQPQKYDHGPIDNLRVYGSLQPPRYDLSKIKLPNWILFSAGNDKLATKSSVDQLLRSVSRQPHRHFHVERYSHIDLIAGVENDKYVNLPILEFLDEFALERGSK